MMNLKKIRTENKLKQEEMAKIGGVSLGAYNKYEKGIRTPQLETLVKMANYFDVSLDYLCGRQWNNQIGYISDATKEVVKMMIKLNDEEIERVKAYVTAQLDAK